MFHKELEFNKEAGPVLSTEKYPLLSRYKINLFKMLTFCGRNPGSELPSCSSLRAFAWWTCRMAMTCRAEIAYPAALYPLSDGLLLSYRPWTGDSGDSARWQQFVVINAPQLHTAPVESPRNPWPPAIEGSKSEPPYAVLGRKALERRHTQEPIIQPRGKVEGSTWAWCLRRARKPWPSTSVIYHSQRGGSSTSTFTEDNSTLFNPAIDI